MGYAEEAPYDAIHVGAAAPVVPQAVSHLCLVCVIHLSLSCKKTFYILTYIKYFRELYCWEYQWVGCCQRMVYIGFLAGLQEDACSDNFPVDIF